MLDWVTCIIPVSFPDHYATNDDLWMRVGNKEKSVSEGTLVDKDGLGENNAKVENNRKQQKKKNPWMKF